MIPVYVCVAGRAEPLPECLAALGDAARVARAATVWQARARVLEEATDELIAFVDGDVVVAPEWSDRLAAAWDAADWQIGAIGGPIDGSGAAVTAAVDWGDNQLDVDPLQRTLPAGNLSFRRRALVGAGGFGPTVDGGDARDWLAEEHDAERQLGHWGWLLRYEPSLRARRMADWDGAPVGGRFRYGQRLAIAGNRSARTALPAFARAAAGTGAAALRRDPLRRSESAARAAENAGVLTASVPRRRGSGAPSGSGAYPRSRGGRPFRQGTAAFVLLYHRVVDAAADPLKLCVSRARFAEHVAILQEHFTVISMDEMAADRPSGAVAITFDDGYLDNVAALSGLDIPVTLFAATGHIAGQRPFFWDELAALFNQADKRKLTLTIGGRRFQWPTRTFEQRAVAMRDLHFRLQPSSPETIEASMVGVRAWAGGVPRGAAPLMTVDELRDLAVAGVDIGAHSVRHLNLAHQTPEVLAAEVTGSRDAVAEWTGAPPRGFSYPYGIPRHDVDAAARKAVQEAGFAYAVVNQPTPVMPEADPLALPRLFAPDVSGTELLARVQPIVSR